MLLRLAQELAYLYGEADLWSFAQIDSEKVTNQLILYCGVMFGVSGATQTVRLLSSALAKQVLIKLQRKALTKTFFYPIVKSICKVLGVRMTKTIFAKTISKAIPIIGGVVSGGLTYTTMRPMGQRLANTLDEAHFNYSHAAAESDLETIMEVCETSEEMSGEED